jgi:carbamoyl-phosphate synthase large subunit
MEHIELAGVHSGDSACAIPPDNIKKEHIETIEKYTKMLALELNVIGLLNIQYAIVNDTVYILEANPRASRTVPLVSKVCGIPMAKIATKLMLGSKLSPDLAVKKKIKHFGVKEAVFPFNMFPEVDPVLGPEMRSTGEVLGIANSFGVAYFKAQDAAGWRLPLEGNILITVNRKDREGALEVAKKFHSLGFTIIATEGTSKYLDEHGIPAQMVFKLNEGRPDVVDRIKNKEINLIINTPFGRISEVDDSYIRKAAIKYKIPYITTIAAARAAVRGIEMIKQYGEETPKSLQEYHSEMS